MGVYKRGDLYWIDYRANGRRYRESVGPSKTLAKETLYKRKVEIAENKFFPSRVRKASTFNEVADLYWENHAKHKPSIKATYYTLKPLKAFFADTPLNQITTLDVVKYLNGVKERTSAATANRHHNVLRAIFNRAIAWELFNGQNPAAKVRQFRVDNARTRFLETNEIPILLAACDDEIRPIVTFALLTGMRHAEMLNLRWEHIDLTNGVVHVLKTKSGDPREIPIAPRLRALLDSLRKGDGGTVFNISSRALNRHFNKAAKLAGMNDIVLHTLRHSFASHFVMRTNDLPATQKLLGHKSPRMTQRYAHLSKGHLQVGMQIFDSGLSHVLQGATPSPRPTETTGSHVRNEAEQVPGELHANNTGDGIQSAEGAEPQGPKHLRL